MPLRQRSRRFGGTVILCTLLLRLHMLGAGQWLLTQLAQPNIAALLTYIETGRIVRFSASSEDPPAHEAESAAPWILPKDLPVFGPQDAAAAKLYYVCSLRPDLEALMEQPLRWDLTGEKPTVLILHSHATECYTRTTEEYTETSAYRTLDERYNMLSIGDRVAQVLLSQGIGVIQDRSLHDHPNYNTAYGNSRSSAESYLAQYPSIRLVLDLHRDASDGENQLRTAAPINGASCAQLMLVMGTNAGGLRHEGWEDNLSLALKLQTQLERQAPGITRPISLRSQRFNQDLSPGALLVEVGAAGDTHGEALRAAEQLAQAIAALAEGTGG